MRSGGKFLECTSCSERFSLKDARENEFWTDSMTCSRCYARMQAAPYGKSCFGKPIVKTLDGELLYGWNPSRRECSKLCRDKNACRTVMMNAFRFGKEGE